MLTYACTPKTHLFGDSDVLPIKEATVILIHVGVLWQLRKHKARSSEILAGRIGLKKKEVESSPSSTRLIQQWVRGPRGPLVSGRAPETLADGDWEDLLPDQSWVQEWSWWAGLGVSYDGGPVASRRLSTSLSDLLNSRLFKQVSTDQKCLRVIKYANGQSALQIWRHTGSFGLQTNSRVLFFVSCLMWLSSSLSWRQLVVQQCNMTVNVRWGLTYPPLTPPTKHR